MLWCSLVLTPISSTYASFPHHLLILACFALSLPSYCHRFVYLHSLALDVVVGAVEEKRNERINLYNYTGVEVTNEGGKTIMTG